MECGTTAPTFLLLRGFESMPRVQQSRSSHQLFDGMEAGKGKERGLQVAAGEVDALAANVSFLFVWR
jgi:hypothetical protein